jgi:subtilisin family serine protease
VSDGVVAVAALERVATGLDVARFSNTGAALSAPGVGIVSARAGGGLVSFDGTSMATPHVAGVAALWAQKLKVAGMFSAKQFAASLLASANAGPIVAPLSVEDVGAGIASAPRS